MRVVRVEWPCSIVLTEADIGSARKQLEAANREVPIMASTRFHRPTGFQTNWLSETNGFQRSVSAFGVGLAGLSLAALKDIRDGVVPKRWGVVEAGRVYRSGQLHRRLVRETLRKNGVEVVIDLTHWKPQDPHQQAERSAILELGITAHRLPLRGDGTGDPAVVAHAVAMLAASRIAGNITLVHCAAGSQRTGTVIAVHRLLVRGDPVPRVLAELRDFGWHPRRDRKMFDFLIAHLPDVAERLVRLGTLPRVPQPMPALAAAVR